MGGEDHTRYARTYGALLKIPPAHFSSDDARGGSISASTGETAPCSPSSSVCVPSRPLTLANNSSHSPEVNQYNTLHLLLLPLPLPPL